ncbi:MAG: 5-oxoprolinase subunit PxpB [Gammaproteobacteria bacterium]|nr:5-oxoprolinase subunit PxpB [Gammaproteobacteria bacterium]
MSEYPIRACGDDLLSIAVPTAGIAQQLALDLRNSGDWLEAVGGIDSVVVQFNVAQLSIADAIKALQEITPAGEVEEQAVAPSIQIPVHYGGEFGPDLDALCVSLSLTRDEFIALHCRNEYCVDMLGFTPGFAYIGGLDSRFDVARLANPRQRVEAGSIGVAGGRSGIYALAGPGGWPIIGRTELVLFNANTDEPFLLLPGMRVRFVPVHKS